MRVSVTQENLNRALSIVARVASGRVALPILSNVLITANKNRITLAATNLEIATTYTLSGKVEEEGSLTVPARLLNEFVSSLPAVNIELVTKGAHLELKTNQYESTINGTPADEFPSLPSLSSKTSQKLKAKALKHAIQQTIQAASSDEARQVLTGLFLHTNSNQLYLVATDSYRLAEKRLGALKTDLSLLIPSGAMQDLVRILGDGDDEVELLFDEGQALFRYKEVELVSRLIDGTFPDYRQLIPKDNEVTFTINRDDFINITKVSSLFARESAGSVTLHVSEESKEVSIRSVASQVGENTSRASATVQGTGEITLNSHYLLDALNVMNDEEVTFAFSGKINPCVLWAGDRTRTDYQHVIMPLRS